MVAKDTYWKQESRTGTSHNYEQVNYWSGLVDLHFETKPVNACCCCVMTWEKRLVTHGNLFRLEVATIVEKFLKHAQQLQYVLQTHQLSTANESMSTNPPSPYGRGNHSTKTWKDKQHELHVISIHFEDHLPSFVHVTLSGINHCLAVHKRREFHVDKLDLYTFTYWLVTDRIRKWLDILSLTLALCYNQLTIQARQTGNWVTCWLAGKGGY